MIYINIYVYTSIFLVTMIFIPCILNPKTVSYQKSLISKYNIGFLYSHLIFYADLLANIFLVSFIVGFYCFLIMILALCICQATMMEEAIKTLDFQCETEKQEMLNFYRMRHVIKHKIKLLR